MALVRVREVRLRFGSIETFDGTGKESNIQKWPKSYGPRFSHMRPVICDVLFRRQFSIKRSGSRVFPPNVFSNFCQTLEIQRVFFLLFRVAPGKLPSLAYR